MKTTARTITPSSPSAELYLQLAQQHGHYCPMSTLGLRLGLEAMRFVDNQGWSFCYLARTCAVDGLSLALGQTHALKIASRGQHSLICRSTAGRELSFSLTAEALRLAKQYQQLNNDEKQQQLELLQTVAAEQLIQMTGSAE
jgi:formylmethanofuran dehydrogenase subunit E